MYLLFWNEQLMLTCDKAHYESKGKMKKAFAKLFGVNVKYLRVEQTED